MNFASFFKQDVTHWAISGKNGYGKPSFASPVNLKGRVQEQKTITRSAIGAKEIVFGSSIYLSTSVSVGDYLAEGKYTGADPLLVLAAREVKSVSKSRDISGTNTLYTAFLKE